MSPESAFSTAREQALQSATFGNNEACHTPLTRSEGDNDKENNGGRIGISIDGDNKGEDKKQW